jgi:hypothetical protein
MFRILAYAAMSRLGIRVVAGSKNRLNRVVFLSLQPSEQDLRATASEDSWDHPAGKHQA